MSEPLQCSICQDGFSSPVVLPCGHGFCLGCIGEYWRLHRPYRCPLCRALFPSLPQLKLQQKEGEIKEAAVPLKAGEVSCDVCLSKQRAVRSCVQCLASYCGAHLEPHYQDKELRSHHLINVAKNLEGSICGLHGKQVDRFCRSDQTCICVMCAQTDHRGHNVVSITKEAAKKRVTFHKHFSYNMTSRPIARDIEPPSGGKTNDKYFHFLFHGTRKGSTTCFMCFPDYRKWKLNVKALMSSHCTAF